MAKRVNTRFLTILIVVLIAIFGGIAGVYYVLIKINNNPTRLVAEAKAALKKNDTEMARQLYQQAAVVALREHLPQAADILLELGDLNYQTTPKDIQRYRAALSDWHAAIQQNPNLLSARKKLLDAFYQDAIHSGNDSSLWQQIQQQATKVIKLDPKNATAYMDRAQARLRSVSGLAALTDRRFTAAKADLLQACRLQPNNILPHSMLAEVYLQQAAAEHAENLINQAAMTKLFDKGIAILQTFVTKHPRDVDALISLAAIYRTVPGHAAQSVKALAAAEKLAPNNPKVLEAKAQQMLVSGASPASIAEIFKKIAAIKPDDMSAYAAAGEFLRRANEPQAAIEYLKRGLTHPAPGGGLIPEINQSVSLRINQMLMGAYLQLAMEAPGGSKARQNYLARASDTLAWVAQRMPQSAWVYVARARLRFAQGRLDASQRWIAQADAILSPGNQQDLSLWLTEKQLQAQIYQIRGQSGSALGVFNEIQKYLPGQPSVALARAQLMVQQNPKAALAEAQAVLKSDPKNVAALKIEALSLANLNRRGELAQLLARINTSDSFSLAQLKARLDLSEKRYTEAEKTMAPWVKQSPGDPRVVTVAYAAMAGLHQRSAAQALITAALKSAPTNLQFILINDQLSNRKNPMPSVTLGPLTSNIAQISVAGVSAQQAQLEAIAKLPDPLERGLLMSRFYLSSGNAAKAASVLVPLAKAHPDNTRILKAQFRVAIAQKNFKLAKQLVKRGADINADGYDGAFLRAQLQIAQGNSASAATTLAAVLKKHPDNANIKTFYGIALLSSGNVRDGVTALTGALQAEPDDIDALTALVQYYLQVNNPASIQRARNLVDQGLAYYPQDTQLEHWHYQFADQYGKPGPEIKRRLAIYQRDPADLNNIAELAMLYMRAKEPSRAVDILQKARKSQPDNLQLARELGEIYVLEKNSDAAQQVFESLAENTDKNIAFAGRLMLGDFYQNTGDLNQAAQVYEAAMKDQPKGHHTVQRRLGDMYFNAGHFKLALRQYAALHSAVPNNRTITLRYAETLIRAGDPARGIALLKKRILSKNPADEEALVLEGFGYLQSNHKNKAKLALTHALSLNPHDPHALYDMATLLLSPPKPQVSKAIADLQLLTQSNATDTAAEQLLAQAYAQAGEYAEAVYEYNTILKSAPNDQAARLQLATLLFELSQRFLALSPADSSDAAASLRTLQPLQRLNALIAQSHQAFPASPQWVMLRARFDLLTGHKNSAVASAGRAFQMANQSTAAAIVYVQVLQAVGKLHTAISVASKALAVSPDAVELYLERGNANAKLANFAASSEDFSQALKRTTGNAAQFFTVLSAYQSSFQPSGKLAMILQSIDALGTNPHIDPALIDAARAVIQFANKQYQDGLSSAKAALAAEPSADIRHAALEIAAFSCYQLKQYDACRNYYQEILQANANNPAILNNLAYLLAVKLHEPAKALAYAERCNTLLVRQAGSGQYAPNGDVLDTLGWIRFLNGDINGAADALDHSLRYNPPATAYYHLARVLVAQKNNVRAVEILKKGIKLAQSSHDPILPRAEELLKKIQG
jgi:tetratricopeptide (TPR) repeat protein